MASVFPPPLQRQVDGIVIQERSVIGNVVLHRRSWTVATGGVAARAGWSGRTGRIRTPPPLAQIARIPERVFTVEKVPHPILGFRHKPQYLDLASPLFVRMLRSMLVAQGESFELVEMLPSAAMFPRDAKGRPWAIELLVDSLAFRKEFHFSHLPAPSGLTDSEQPQG